MTRIEQLASRLPNNVCALIGDDVNRRYFTGFKSSAGTLLIFNSAAYLIIDSRYFEKAQDVVRDCQVVKQEDKLYKQIGDIAGRHSTKKILVESERLTLSSFSRLKKELPMLSFDGGDSLSIIIKKMRSVKTGEEIDFITRAQRIAENALNDALDFIREGVTEREIALFLNDRMFKGGAEDLSFETIALCGADTSMPHGVPSDRPVCRGDFILMDFGAVYNGYHSDMTRTVVLGEPTAEMEQVYNIVLTAQQRAIDAARAGITAKELDRVARDYISKTGYGDSFGHGLGHSLGLEIHESPAANTRDNTVLTENMLMTIEPGVYLAKKFGVRIEDFVVIEQNSCRNISAAPKNLIKL